MICLFAGSSDLGRFRGDLDRSVIHMKIKSILPCHLVTFLDVIFSIKVFLIWFSCHTGSSAKTKRAVKPVRGYLH